MVMVDNPTAECVISQMGTSHGSKLNTLAKAIWQWCAGHGIWITMGHIPGCENSQADKESWVFNLNGITYKFGDSFRGNLLLLDVRVYLPFEY